MLDQALLLDTGRPLRERANAVLAAVNTGDYVVHTGGGSTPEEAWLMSTKDGSKVVLPFDLFMFMRFNLMLFPSEMH
jgi:hypothetical protein